MFTGKLSEENKIILTNHSIFFIFFL